MAICSKCGSTYTQKHQPGFREVCSCGQSWHSCTNCRFYDGTAREWCREPAARDEKPRDESTSNLCSYFMINDRASSDGEGASRSDEAKRKLAELFGDSPEKKSNTQTADWMKFDKPDSSDIFG